MPWRRGAALAMAMALAGGSTPAMAGTPDACPAAPVQTLSLPATKAALAGGKQVLIVALGSSSSRGAAASNPAHSYPAILEARLSALLPTASIAVINRGNDGEDAPRELTRLATDVIALRPQTVIWQVGANGAMRGTDPAVFHALVGAGVAKLRESGIDVVLMDNQRAPAIVRAAHHEAIERALAQTAAENASSLFSRGALMDAWRDAGFGYELFVSPDGLHHNDRGYRCVAEALAKAIAAAAVP